MRFSDHPLWLVGFRPFFILACILGASFPVLWALVFSGTLTLPTSTLTPTQWHAHEMFYGFGWAVLGGFLLTSTKNWVNIRGYHGRALIYLVAAWLLERAGMWAGDALPPPLFRLSNNLFLGSIVIMLLSTLIRHRASDSYRDNLIFIVVLPVFIIAKNLLLTPEYFNIGVSLTQGLFRMAFLVMLERTLTQFMKGAFQVNILRQPLLDGVIKLLGLAFVFESLMPRIAASSIALLLATLLSIRFAFWKPQLGLRRIEIGVMYLGYLAIVAQLLIEAWRLFSAEVWIGAVSIHVFTFGAMGLIIPAMLIRIANGHTGRKVVFAAADKAVLWIMIASFIARIVAPQYWPENYPAWIHISATCWFAGFAILAWRLTPKLLQARVDGREH